LKAHATTPTKRRVHHPRVVAVIPALDEEGTVGAVVSGLLRATEPPLSAVIVCDNGSSDGTADRARAAGALVVTEPERGYGAACLAALAAARELEGGPPDIVVFADADGADVPEDLPWLLAPILRGRADLVIGSRALHTSARQALFPQARFGNLLAVTLIRLLWGARFTDLGPFRAVAWEALERVDMRDRDFGWTVELQIKAARLGLRHTEVAVRYRNRGAGQSKVSGTLTGSVRAGVKILTVIARHALG
jgi:glycosyltransferase involved in cell wall biosynthesis